MKSPEEIASKIAQTMSPFGLGDLNAPHTAYEAALIAAIEADRAQRTVEGDIAWTDFELDDSSDAIPDKYVLTIYDDTDGEEIAVIVHRTASGRFPIDGKVADQKRENARCIVAALNAHAQRAGGLK